MEQGLVNDSINQGCETCEPASEAKLGFFDYIFGVYIIAMLATNYSGYNNLLSNLGMVIVVLFFFSLFISKYRFQREFYLMGGLFLWILLGALLSRYRAISLFSAFYVLKVQFVMLVVALRCSSFRRLKFYLTTAAVGTAFLVVPSLVTSRYLSFDARLQGTVGQANAMGQMSACSFVAWICLLCIVKGWWKWVIFPALAVVSLRVLMLSGSRGSFVGIAFFLVMIYWSIWRKGRLSIKFLFPVVVLIVGVCLSIWFRDLPIIQRLMGLPIAIGLDLPISVSGQSAEISRLLIVKRAWEVFLQHPILGAGWGTFRLYSFYVYTHTTPFEFLYATGVVGTGLYYFVIFGGWYTVFRAKKVGRYIPHIVRNIRIADGLVVFLLGIGLAIPCPSSKALAVLTGAWLGLVWYMRLWTKEQLEYQHGDEADFELDEQMEGDLPEYE